jgi:hypothetical protein
LTKELGYMVSSEIAWNEKAATTAQVEIRPNEQSPEAIIISGTCPRCNDLTVQIEPIIIYSGFRSNAVREALLRAAAKVRKRDVEVICACGITHQGAPSGQAGCGASWVLRVSWDG